MERDKGKCPVTREITQVKIMPDDYDDDGMILVVTTVMMMICLLPNHFLFIIYPTQFTLHNLSNMNTNYHLTFNICLSFHIAANCINLHYHWNPIVTYINKTVKLKKSCVQNYYNVFCIMAALYILPHYIYLAQAHIPDFRSPIPWTLNYLTLMVEEGKEG